MTHAGFDSDPEKSSEIHSRLSSSATQIPHNSLRSTEFLGHALLRIYDLPVKR